MLETWLQNVAHITDVHVHRTLKQNGYTDDSFLCFLTEKDLKEMGLHRAINGRAVIAR